MRPPATQADVLELSRQVDGLFAAAFTVSHEFGVPGLAYVADAFEKPFAGAVGAASRAICEAARRAAMTGRPVHQMLERATYPTLVVAAVPFADGGGDGSGVVRAAFGVIFYCEDQGECDRRVGTLSAAAGV